MAYTLECNENNFLALDTLSFGDLNMFDPSSLSVLKPDGTYWHTQKGTPLNAKIIYDWMVSNGYGVKNYNITQSNCIAAYGGDTAKYDEFMNNFYWLVGGFDQHFGVYFAIDAANRVQIKGFSYNLDSQAFYDYGLIVNTTTAAVSEGDTDNRIYLCDYVYVEGDLQPTWSSYLEGRYEVTVREDLEREWYYYNNIDMVAINDTDSAFSSGINRKVPYVSKFTHFSNNRQWHEIAKDSPYVTKPDPYSPSGGSTEPDGGNGTTRVSVDIPMPTAPPDMLLDSGIVKIYKPTAQQISDFIDYVYSQPTAIADNFKKIWADPMQSIISLGIVPFNVQAKDSMEVVRFCGISTNVSMYPVSTQFPTWDFGTLKLSEETNSFLDYSSYTKVKINLPFIGICDLNADDVVDATLTLNYIFDIATGDCVAHIKCTKYREAYGIGYNSPLYEFSGNMLATAPLSGNNWQGLYSSVLRASSNIFMGMMSGNVGGAAITAGVDFLTSNKVDVKRSGSVQGNGSHLGNYIPYLIVECPVVSTTTSMFDKQGYPMNKTYSVKTLNEYQDSTMKTKHICGSGLTVFQKGSVFVDNINATDQEKEMIREILESEVIFNTHPKE